MYLSTPSQVVDSTHPFTIPQGKYFRLISTSAVCTVEFFGHNNQKIGEMIDVQEGAYSDDMHFMHAKITSATSQTIKCMISDTPCGNDVNYGTVDSTELAGSTFANKTDVSIPTATSTAIIAANTDRKYIEIQADPTNTGEIRIKGTDDTNVNGIGLSPGQSITEYTTAAFYSYHATGSTEKVRVSEVEK